MPNGTTHAIVGGLSGLGVAFCNQSNNTDNANNLFYATFIGTVFGKLPDILEPALHSHHRQFFHSFTFLVAIGYALKKIHEWETRDDTDTLLRLLILCAGAAYISHLVLDGMTPRSLPLMGKI